MARHLLWGVDAFLLEAGQLYTMTGSVLLVVLNAFILDFLDTW